MIIHPFPSRKFALRFLEISEGCAGAKELAWLRWYTVSETRVEPVEERIFGCQLFHAVIATNIMPIKNGTATDVGSTYLPTMFDNSTSSYI